MALKTQPLHVRLTLEESEAFKKLAAQKGTYCSELLRKMIREAINNDIDLLTDEKTLLKIALRQLIGITNHINPITAAIPTEKTHPTLDQNLLEKLQKSVDQLKKAFQEIIQKTQNRWVKSL